MTADGEALFTTAASLVAPGKGILAADETVPTISKRFASVGVHSTEITRRDYRELLFTAPGIDAHVSGAILQDETIRQRGAAGTPLPEVLTRRGILVGIKVDTGVKALAGAPGESVTEGLDGLRERIAEYRALGARFAKWRAVLRVAAELPTARCVHANAHALARYAALCQEGGLVPIVEPEVLMDGDHDLARSGDVARYVLAEVFEQLRLFDVQLDAIVLKPSMVTPGSDSRPAPLDAVARATVECLRDTVPEDVPGIAFLSGGQAPSVATRHLDAIARLRPQPWALTFSFGRALQDEVLATWRGEAAMAATAQDVLAHRTRCNHHAALGTYDDRTEDGGVAAAAADRSRPPG